jgi:hypothetical protein
MEVILSLFTPSQISFLVPLPSGKGLYFLSFLGNLLGIFFIVSVALYMLTILSCILMGYCLLSEP